MAPALGPILAELPPTRRALIVALRKRGEARVEELAQGLAITASAVRQHLSGLAAAGLVTHRDQRAGPGRPRRSYRLTDAADGLFPKAYGDLTLELLHHLSDEDPEMVARAFERRRQARVARVQRRLVGRSFAGRVAEIAAVLAEDGYLADFQQIDDDRFHLREHNCAILAVAERWGHACQSELGFLRELLPDAEVTRIAHILNGAHACIYEVRRRPPAAGSVDEGGDQAVGEQPAADGQHQPPRGELPCIG